MKSTSKRTTKVKKNSNYAKVTSSKTKTEISDTNTPENNNRYQPMNVNPKKQRCTE